MPPNKITQVDVRRWITEGLTEAVAELQNGTNNNNTANTSNQLNQNNQNTTNTQNNNTQNTTNTRNDTSNQHNNTVNTNNITNTNTNQGGCTYKTFLSCEPHSFTSKVGPVGLTSWFEKLESVFRISGCREVDRTKFASFIDQAFKTTWEDLKQRMIEEYCPYNEIVKMKREPQNLKLVGTDLANYNKRFFELALMCPNMVTPECRKITLYVKGLTENIQGGVTTSKPRTVHEGVEMAHELMDQIELRGKTPVSVETKNFDNKGKWNNNNSGKNYNLQPYKKQDTAKGNITALNTNSGYKGKYSLCAKYNRYHPGNCNNVCDKCKENGHLASECKDGTNVCFGCEKTGHFRKDCPNANKNTEPARGRAFNINSSKACDDPKLVTCTFLLSNHHAYVFFDYGADRSFVSKDFCHNLKNPVSSLENMYSIELGNGNLLSENRATIVCYQKAIRIPVAENEPLMVYGERSNTPLHFINCLKAQKHIRKGGFSMLIHVSKTEPEVKKLEDVLIVRDFPDIFLDELPGLPLHRDVEFQIDLMPGKAPVARTI
ncbi:uncharacterized protein [Rutidosis leptorrhynchoides]|uniref:uncharacterized protein n=1 Tax=Rutidosis leptorrhynchoides TaxID=125765 RepID=UPI003A996D4F